jgi:hypothetical protein
MEPSSQFENSSRRILITGASGLIGSRLVAALRADGFAVAALVRREPRPGGEEIRWEPEGGQLDPAAVEGFDAVIHLAGENIAAGRWTPQRKQLILRSRMEGTDLLCRTLAILQRRPRVLVSASAVGYYGHRGDELVDESSPPGKGFLAEVSRQWEVSTQAAKDAGIRVVNLRLGMVLSAAGGALPRMLGPFKAGLGGVVGSGRQYVSWIAIDDLVGAVCFAIATEDLAGPVNAVSPGAVTNREFVATLARVLHRPAVVPLPAIAVRLMYGEMGQSLLLEGARVQPAKLLQGGFSFRYPDLEAALRHELQMNEPARGAS